MAIRSSGAAPKSEIGYQQKSKLIEGFTQVETLAERPSRRPPRECARDRVAAIGQFRRPEGLAEDFTMVAVMLRHPAS